MKNELPRISIITPNLNQGRFLAQAIESVIAQQYPNYEHFVIDGGSTDESLEVIKKYESQLTGWVSELDKGQSDAINKGIKMATGEIVTWLNADDFFAPNVFYAVANAFEDHDAMIISGFYESFSDKGERYRDLRMIKYSGLEETIFFGMISTPAMFYRRDIYEKLGYYNTSLHYFFDLDFYYRFLLEIGMKHLKLIDANITIFRLHENSKTVSLKDGFRTESYHLHKTMLTSMKPPLSVPDFLELPHRKLDLPVSWKTDQLDHVKMLAYFGEKTLERMHRDFSIIQFFKVYFWSFKQKPFGRQWRFYLLPLRKIGWIIKGI